MSAKPVELNLWVMPNAGAFTHHVMERLLVPFHKKHSGIRVKVTVLPWSTAWTQLVSIAKHRRGEYAPDVLQVGNTWTCTLAYLGVLRNMEQFYPDFTNHGFVRIGCTYCRLSSRKRLFAVPWFIDIRVLYYRKDILELLGLDATALDDWESFRDTCRRINRLRKNDKCPYALALSGQKEDVLIHDIAPWIWGAGGSFLGPDMKSVVFDKTEAVNGMRFYYGFMEDGSIPLMGRDRMIGGDFFSGRFVLQFSGAWPANSFFSKDSDLYSREVAQNYGLAFFPKGPAGRFTYLGGSQLGMCAHTRYPEESLKLLRYLTSQDVQVQHAKAIGMMPCFEDGFEVVFPKSAETMKKVFKESIKFARTLPPVRVLGAMERIFTRLSHDVIKKIIDKSYSPGWFERRVVEAHEETKYVLSIRHPTIC